MSRVKVESQEKKSRVESNEVESKKSRVESKKNRESRVKKSRVNVESRQMASETTNEQSKYIFNKKYTTTEIISLPLLHTHEKL